MQESSSKSLHLKPKEVLLACLKLSSGRWIWKQKLKADILHSELYAD